MKTDRFHVIIQPNGTITSKIVPKKNEYAHLSKAVGGHIETVGYFSKYRGKKCIAYVNEEGIDSGLRPEQYRDKVMGRPIQVSPTIGWVNGYHHAKSWQDVRRA